MSNDDQREQTAAATEGQIAHAEAVHVHQGGIGRAAARHITVTEGGIGLARGDTISVTNGGVTVLVAQQARLDGANVVFVVAREVSGEARILVDLRAAVVVGGIVGSVLGLVSWITTRRRS